MQDHHHTPPPARKRHHVARVILGAAALAGLVCCGWVAVQFAGSLLADFTFFVAPPGVMALVAVAAVLGWITGVLRRWSKTRVALVALALIVATPAAILGGWIIKGTLDAGKGALCPTCAIDEYIWNVLDEPIRLRNALCADRRDELDQQARSWRDTYHAALNRWQLTARLDIAAPTHKEVNENRANVTMPVAHTHDNHWRIGGIASRKEVPWHFELVNDNGWRVCAVTLPNVCTQLTICDGPPPTPSPTTATPSPASTPSVQASWRVWDNRVSWWCTDDAGTLKRQDCPTPPSDWVQPGPWQCAPEYPFRTPQTTTWCRQLGWNVT